MGTNIFWGLKMRKKGGIHRINYRKVLLILPSQQNFFPHSPHSDVFKV